MVRHSSRIELSQSSLKGNINFLKKKLGSDTRLSLVVKANAYGHGISEYVPMAEKCGIDHFSVASSHEAEEVLKVCKPETRIMIMGILYEEDLEWAINHGIEFYVLQPAASRKRLQACEKLRSQSQDPPGSRNRRKPDWCGQKGVFKVPYHAKKVQRFY